MATPRSPGEAARFALVVSREMAAALGITMPQPVLLRADEVIA